MIIFDYNKILKKHNGIIQVYAKKISKTDYDDHCQYIRIYIYNHLDRFDPVKSSLKYFINLMVLTAYRRIVFDRTKQETFENSFCIMYDDTVPFMDSLNFYENVISKVADKIEDKNVKLVFYAILYYRDDLNYFQMSKKLNISYPSFLSYIKRIREITSKTIRIYLNIA